MSATVTTHCRFCGEAVVISGHLYALPGDRIGFTSDEDGTKTAWDHQAKHEKEA